MSSTPDKLLKPYDPKETEARIYKQWEESGLFNPNNLPKRHKEPFTIIMPPPNANGSLHAGHAVFVTIEDLMIRFRRMQGYKTLWLPGADHAGFETQVVYEKKLEKEGRSRFGMDPAELRKEILAFTMENKQFMENQLRQLGASCDWSREKFTLDQEIVDTVYETFKKLSDDGLVYRGKRTVNWCTKHQTSLSDLETDFKEQTDSLYYIKYGPFIVATVRPETIFGDVAVAVNPNDPRYKQYIGKDIEVVNPIGTLKLKVVADEAVDIEFGTGALKITPAHDTADFELSKRHNLPGLKVKEARIKVVEDLQALNLIEKIEEYKHSVSTCYKCGTIVEPRLMSQWFIKMKSLAEAAEKVIGNDEITFTPDRFKKISLQWLENIRDWNVSRQIAWGIPIPAKICLNCDNGFVDIEDKLKTCPTCNNPLQKDTDTFDTWFSSGQWPFATLGYPDKDDFKTFYPTDVMETAGEIIFFWVARMIMLGIYRTGKIPFKHVYLHGIVTAKDGQKMSKSKGNVISPIDISDKYGTDALRMALIIGNTPGTSTALYEDKIKGYKNFANKLWNITRFVLTNQESGNRDQATEITIEDQKLIDTLNTKVADISKDIEEYRFYMAAEKTYHYIWHEFADTIIEESKPILAGTDEQKKKSRQQTLLSILSTSIKVLHPFMPFVTEELWSLMPNTSKMLLVEEWPTQKNAR